MSQILIKMTPTTQGWAALIEKPQNRFEAIRPMFEEHGDMKLLDYWFAVDQNAVYLHIEGTENLTHQLSIVIAALGSGDFSSMETTRLLTAAEAVEAMKLAKSQGYRSPTGTTPQKK